MTAHVFVSFAPGLSVLGVDSAPSGLVSSLHDTLFLLFACLTIIAGFFVVAAKDIVHAAVALIFTLFGVATLYLFLQAPFLAAVQVLVYAGGVSVLLLFGIMLTRRSAITAREKTTLARPERTLAGVLVAALLFGLFYLVLVHANLDGWRRQSLSVSADAPLPPAVAAQGDPGVLGEKLLTDFLLPFEIASVLLLIALVGAAYIARRREPEDAASPAAETPRERAS